MFKTLKFLLLLIPIFFSCEKDSTSMNGGLSTKEMNILTSCRDMPLTDPDTIKENLVGIWELVGFACSYCVVDRDYMPTASVVFTKNEGLYNYDDGQDKTLLSFEWELEAITNGPGFYVKTTPENWNLAFSSFCDDYIIVDQRAGDGSLFIYQKK